MVGTQVELGGGTGTDTILTGLAALGERVRRSPDKFPVMRAHRSAKRDATGAKGFLSSLAAMLLACSGEPPPKSEQPKTAEVATAESALAAMPAPGGGCPTYGLWQACNVEDRISRAGLAVNRREEGVQHDFMSVDGLVWETSRAEIQVFLYASEADRKRDTDMLDTVFVAPEGRRVMWRWPATLVTSNNMAAIILSLNGRQAERIALALGAGLPPAPR
jgi:hypothetical protein